MFRAGGGAEGTCQPSLCLSIKLELPQQLHFVDFWLHPIGQTWVWSYGDIANTNIGNCQCHIQKDEPQSVTRLLTNFHKFPGSLGVHSALQLPFHTLILHMRCWSLIPLVPTTGPLCHCCRMLQLRLPRSRILLAASNWKPVPEDSNTQRIY